MAENTDQQQTLENLSFLVTGGFGFIGSHIVKGLLKKGAKLVRILDNSSSGKIENVLKILKKYKNIQIVHGDILDYDTCKKAVEGMDAICHHAALVSVPLSIEKPLLTHDINVTGSLNLLNAAKECNVKRFVYATSSAVYGDDNSLYKKEDVIGNQLSPYGLTKYMDEQYAKIYTDLFGLECIGLRYFNVYGPKQDPNAPYASVIPKFVDLFIKNKRPIIYGDGSCSRDFVYVGDIVNANIRALTIISDNNSIFGDNFNVGSGEYYTVLELFNKIRIIMGKDDIEPRFESPRSGDAPHTCSLTTKTKNNLKFETQTSFDEGLKKTVAYYVK